MAPRIEPITPERLTGVPTTVVWVLERAHRANPIKRQRPRNATMAA
jgi:hypothetical protein